MSCKSDVKYNFGRASEYDELVYGSARPGAVGQRCFNPEDKVTVAEVDEWSDHLASHGIRRVVSLLTPSELATYDGPPLHQTLGRRFARAVNVDAKAPGAVETLLAELREAEAAGDKVVVHCWGGGGRTGVALAAWLVRRHGLEPEAAAAAVEKAAVAQGTSRRADVAQLRQFLGLGVAT
ncbi:hypothetical protein GPECTOR_165g156 [Gonium pectorale]|uniref:Tyrosine specific protein phosphatases domain-containing protein n=1 Tax=Gonium pectorale TaxID=33097 RepID=A0A150FXG6_GONPE|nr:hypothetical protein GPECTOR_165g156 [Gonium pectorale]|eukprot:KXZ42296.1 hypothetical protein GPECTOR_165g156 [Gonium pectorale]